MAQFEKPCHVERSEISLTIFFFQHVLEEENSQRFFASLRMTGFLTGFFYTEPLPADELSVEMDRAADDRGEGLKGGNAFGEAGIFFWNLTV